MVYFSFSWYGLVCWIIVRLAWPRMTEDDVNIRHIIIRTLDRNISILLDLLWRYTACEGVLVAWRRILLKDPFHKMQKPFGSETRVLILGPLNYCEGSKLRKCIFRSFAAEIRHPNCKLGDTSGCKLNFWVFSKVLEKFYDKAQKLA